MVLSRHPVHSWSWSQMTTGRFRAAILSAISWALETPPVTVETPIRAIIFRHHLLNSRRLTPRRSMCSPRVSPGRQVVKIS